MNKVEEKIRDLREEVIKHDLAYAKGDPIISDTEYDKLYLKLVGLEELYPEYSDENSPTKRIIDIKVEGLKKVEHTIPMLSQKKINTPDELDKFIRQMNDELLVEDKLDGLTVIAKYNNGVLYEGITRGDGKIGDDITHIVLNTPNIPKTIPFNDYLEIRLEGIIPNEDFEMVNSILEEEDKYKSSRNLASGTVRSLNGCVAKERGLKLIAFELVKADNIIFEKDYERLEFLKTLGFDVVNYTLFKKNEEDILKLKDYIFSYNQEVRPFLSYKVDGLVIKANSLELRDSLGNTSKYPKWSSAFKFENEEAITKLKDCIIEVGKSGQLTPVALFEPVQIDGITISKATLSNFKNVKDKDIKIGDMVVVARANDVIPKIEHSIKEDRTGEEKEIEIPKFCPVCNEPIVKENVHYFCVNDDCPAQIEGKIIHFVSKKSLDIDGLGEESIKLFLDNGLISSIIDIFYLKDKKDDLLKLDKYADKKVSNLLENIEASKQASLSKILHGLSIKLIGGRASKELANKFISMKNILNISKNEEEFKQSILSINNFGEEMSNNLVLFFKDERNIELINKLMEVGFKMEEQIVKVNEEENMLTGKTVVITGKFADFTREELTEKIENEFGGKCSKSVSKKTDFLIYGDKAGSKYNKALELGVKLITEKELLDII
ncbi:TPA: NAD-dependent DNA ligase LigA [Clostridioides difficile]|uniref:NAD-dependent DNA ligase LigA n=1 Tax=Clostridioides difficile TaxID=1496 RepID=UPI000BB1B1FC|nr:NAD-dependent DNA ligase LigA [Clostridioides difficile]EGT3642421.1 NAD-dependent DNA ligase LigA [Clostridioides difficile]MBH7167652.1 NAD-dependent DNA ligase LigA [Clostridioides difficile]MBH7847784.1 NAD-dependent DNA ligase LigA [Clostridioides difficile]MBY1346162.1 NAD-dependent DNA ligase LigA [Clostridioides difficile]MBY1660752.1 NAD-dependent DNA ligase LigA [Clostridioides difficile]